MSEATQKDSERNKSFFQVRWPDGSPTQEEFLMTLPTRRSLKFWESTILNGEESIAWDTLESDMRAVSTQHPNTIFTVEITDEDGERWVEYHQERPALRDARSPSTSRTSTPRDCGKPNTQTHWTSTPPSSRSPLSRSPLSRSPLSRTFSKEALLVIEQSVWDTEAFHPDDELPAMADPYEFGFKPTTSPETALERVPRLREILAAAHQECNQSGGTTERIMDIFHEHVAGVFNHWTFTERNELEDLAREILETLTAKNAKPTVEE